MASRIQGITVEIGGDTTKLSSALSGVNKEIKNTQSQLKDTKKEIGIHCYRKMRQWYWSLQTGEGEIG